MGAELFAITGHNLNYSQIIQFQSKIESNEQLKELYWWKKEGNLSLWSEIVTEERLAQCWRHNKEQIEIDEVFFYDELWFPVFFGKIKFHPNIIELSGWSMKFLTMSADSELRRNILLFYEQLGKLIGQRTIIYFGDSYAKSSWIQDQVYKDTIEDILARIEIKHPSFRNGIDKSIQDEHLYVQFL